MSKFKTVELKGFVAIEVSGWNEQGHISVFKEPDGRFRQPATLTIQIPVEEKKVTLTESEFDQAVLGTDIDFRNTSKSWTELLKSKLFGGEL